MLSANIYYQPFDGDIENIIRTIGMRKKESKYYMISFKSEQEIAVLTIQPEEEKLQITFPGNLSFEEYESIHNAIIQITDLCNGEVDDSQSLIGYLESGEKVNIVKNWDEWSLFINKAKYKTLEGQKVRLLDEKNGELASGLLVEYKFDSNRKDSFWITECTLITSFGERRFSGERLSIEPTDRW
jgi:hypothetical protein